MISVSIEGRAGQMLGPKWKLHVGTVGEALRALRANTGSIFEKALGLSRGYVLVVDGVPTESSGCFLKKIKKNLCFIPILAGGFVNLWWAIYMSQTLMVVGNVAAAIIATVVVVTVVALIAYGIYTLITYLNQDSPDSTDGLGTSSFLFSGPENVAEQGQVVPVAYGRMKTGSKVISVSSSSVDRAIWDEDELGVFGETVVRRSPLAPSREIGGGSARTRLRKAVPSP